MSTLQVNSSENERSLDFRWSSRNQEPPPHEHIARRFRVLLTTDGHAFGESSTDVLSLLVDRAFSFRVGFLATSLLERTRWEGGLPRTPTSTVARSLSAISRRGDLTVDKRALSSRGGMIFQQCNATKGMILCDGRTDPAPHVLSGPLYCKTLRRNHGG